MPTKLSVYNEALRLIKEPPLTSTSETIQAATTLNSAWGSAVLRCLEKENWNFARARKSLALLTTTPVWGYDYKFNKPVDWVRTIFLSPTGEEHDRVRRYSDEGGAIHTNHSPIYMAYVSSTFIELPGNWTGAFADAVSADLATRIAPNLTNASDNYMGGLHKIRQKAMNEARSFNAMQDPPAEQHPGRWAMANRRGTRGGSTTGGGDDGSWPS